MSTLQQNYSEVLERIRRAAEASGRRAESIRLLAVSKTFPAEAIRELYDAGVRLFGESRAPELAEKAAALPADIEWHFIGRLQANKVRKVVQIARMIHSVDTLPLLERIDRIAGEEGRRPEILLEVNVSGEATKAGTAPSALERLAEEAAGCRNLVFCGLMTMAPADATETEIAAVFETLRRCRDALAGRLQIALPVLSMGMSGDFEIAVRHGSTLVRVGSSIFGGR